MKKNFLGIGVAILFSTLVLQGCVNDVNNDEVVSGTSGDKEAIASNGQQEYKNIEAYFNTKKEIDFHGKKYFLVWSSEIASGFYRMEYIPSDETLGGIVGIDSETGEVITETTKNGYENMIIIDFVKGQLSPAQAWLSMSKVIEKRKEIDTVANFKAWTGEHSDNFMIDFIMLEGSVIEWNVYKYQKLQKYINEDGYFMVGVSRRSYQDNDDSQLEFMQELGSMRTEYVHALEKFDVENIFNN